MVFNSLTFLIFFPIVLGIYYIIPKRLRVYWLLAASYYFYAFWNVKYTLLILASTVVTYATGLLIHKARSKVGRNAAVAACVIINLCILFVFKYLDFFLSNVSRIKALITGAPFDARVGLLLPVGISFYTFQAIGYTIDVYRKKTEPEKNFARYALFVSFFPQLVAGPIERSGNLLLQLKKIEKERFFGREQFTRGAFVALYGFILKMIIADRIAILVTNAYELYVENEYYGFQIIIAALLFSIQIFCDFAGYTYIAIGTSAMMGITICDNFRAPYLACGIKEFWDSWHISLSTWFRDYLYFPLGGSKKGVVRKYINIFIVFLVSGLWHGASWHYVVWGCLHGLARIVEEATEGIRKKILDFFGYAKETFSHRFLARVFTFLLVSLFWVFFRAQSVGQAVEIIKRMKTGLGLWQLTDGSVLCMGLDAKDLNILVIFIAFMAAVDTLKKKGKDVALSFARQNIWFQFVCFLAGIMAVIIFGVYGAEYDATSFIYFQF